MAEKKTEKYRKSPNKKADDKNDIPKGFANLKKVIQENLGKRDESLKSEKPSISLKTGKVVEGKRIKPKTQGAGLERIPTGIPGLDKIIEGGLLKKSINLIAGSPGAGKTIFGIQFIVKGIQDFNEPGVYVSFEENKEKFYKYMLEFGWDLAKLEKEKKFAYIKYAPEQVSKLLAEGGGEIENVVRRLKAKRLVIDSISAFTLLFRDELAQRESLLSLFDFVSRWGCTTLLTAEQEASPEKHAPNVIEFEVDGVILLYNYRKRNIRERVAEILKMRGTKFIQKIFPMRITDSGIIFYPEEETF